MTNKGGILLASLTVRRLERRKEAQRNGAEKGWASYLRLTYALIQLRPSIIGHLEPVASFQ
jgi:hypothetical protein